MSGSADVTEFLARIRRPWRISKVKKIDLYVQAWRKDELWFPLARMNVEFRYHHNDHSIEIEVLAGYGFHSSFDVRHQTVIFKTNTNLGPRLLITGNDDKGHYKVRLFPLKKVTLLASG